MISKEQILQILDRTNLIDVVGERVNLSRSGVNYKAPCPFHDEKTASFVVSEVKQVFKCFGCGAAGNAINFLMQYDGLSYPEAIRSLAQKVGIEIVEEYGDKKRRNPEEESLRDQIVLLMAESARFFHHNLLNEIESGENKPLLDYLTKRSVTAEICEHYQLGYAPAGWNSLKKDDFFLGTDNDLLVEIGLLKKSDSGSYYDFFRHRLMFPIFDVAGNVIAFSGRALNNEDQPKYINSPETPVYKKSKVLFGFHQAKDMIRKKKTAILVEGNLDQVSLYKHGYFNSVALCGTAFTEDHAELLKRNCQKVIVMLDSDKAGIKSSFKTAAVLLKKGVETSLVQLSEGDDPDSFLEKSGNDALDALLDNPLSFIDFHLAVKNVEESSETKTAVLREIIDTIMLIPDRIKKTVYVSEAARKLQISEPMLLSEIKKRVQDEHDKAKPQPTEQMVEAERERQHKKSFSWQKEDEVEFNILYLMLTLPNLKKRYIAELTEDYFLNTEAHDLFFEIYVHHEEGVEKKLNELLMQIENQQFSDFFIGYLASQDELYNPDYYSERELEIKQEQAFEDNLRKMKIKKLRRDILSAGQKMKTLPDDALEEQERLLILISELKKAEFNLQQN